MERMGQTAHLELDQAHVELSVGGPVVEVDVVVLVELHDEGSYKFIRHQHARNEVGIGKPNEGGVLYSDTCMSDSYTSLGLCHLLAALYVDAISVIAAYLDVRDGVGQLLGVEHEGRQRAQVAVARIPHFLRHKPSIEIQSKAAPLCPYPCGL
jgi:hypothetical protein